MKKRKTLIITTTPVRTDTNMGKTLLTLFSDFNKDEISQLYFSPELPNTRLLEDYYQICEKQIIKSYFGLFKNKCGGIVQTQQGLNSIKRERNALSLTKNKGNIFIRIAREIIWEISFYKNENFKAWLDSVNPDVIFTIMHDTNAAAKLVNWIAKRYNCPVVLFITDDYYNDQKENRNILRKIYYKKRQKYIKEQMKSATTLIGCSEKITNYFVKELGFKGSSYTLYTPSAQQYLEMPLKKQEGDILKIRYFGNLGLGRWQILREIGLALKNINCNEIKAILEIYSSEINKDIINQLNIRDVMMFKGWVYGDEYLSLLQDADIAVHVESFDKEMINRTWGSVSTKIADYLGAGKCILAVGSKELASIDHIRDVSCTITDLSLLEEKINELIENASYRHKLQEKARNYSNEYHDINKIKQQIRKIIDNQKK